MQQRSRMVGHALGAAAAVALGAHPLCAQQPQQPVDSAAYQALAWRSVGPFRGGRSVAAAGVPTQPEVYYFGGTGGGLWKTTDAGITWKNVSDGFFRTGSVGAVAVSEMDPNVVWVGMGEHAVRGVMTSHGDGVYRSTDAGKTWTHLGLERTRHISRIQVHPRDPDVAWVAAQGAVHGPSADRGVYKTTDGGKSWRKVLFVDENSGASDVSLDVSNPRILYASFWDHRRLPWQVRSGGPGSGIYKSTDGGETWRKLSGGLPSTMGKTAVAVSRADPNRVFALVEADSGGLYRSDDAGATWRRTNSDRVLIARAWYYIEVYPDPQDAETVYVLNAPVLRSVDGGRTFTTVAVPHGDTHDLWINPLDNRRMINANDGGGVVTSNAGETWSSDQNQPTAQFYRVDVDDRFPYFLYAGQQDNSTVATPSRTTGSGIEERDWYPVSGCESAHVAFDPKDPTLVYAGCYQGIIEEFDHRTRMSRSVMAYPYLGLATIPREVKYRFNWSAPIEVSLHDPTVIYHAANVLLRSQDRGRTWTEISPDLSRDEEEKQGPGGAPFTNEGAGGEVYGTIHYIAESPHEAGTIWAGTDDGLVHLTRDGGRSWVNVTPRGLPESQINSIEVSPHDPATAYLAVTRYKFDDFTPHFYRTSDFGRSWTRIVSGLPTDSWARVIREDPVRRNLLYAGTETGAWVSFDGGGRWQSLQLNLPVVPITDLKVKGNDLVAATSGRAFWILDDVAPLRQVGSTTARTTQLYRPSPAYRMEGASRDQRNAGRNPPGGAVLYYTLERAPEQPITLEILDGSGQVIRAYSSAVPDTVKSPSGNWTPRRLPARVGMNRFVWDLRHEELRHVPDLFVNGGLDGARVAPGTYQARLTVGGQSFTQPVEVRADPRYTAAPEDYRAQEAVSAQIGEVVNQLYAQVLRVERVRDQVEAVVENAEGQPRAAEIRAAGEALLAKLDAWQDLVVQRRQKTFQDVINFPNRLDADLLHLREVVDAAEPIHTAGARARLADLMAQWAARQAEIRAILDTDLAAFNRLVREANVPPVVGG